MTKKLSYYMSLAYRIEIQAIPKELGGGFEASIPQLGRYAFIGQGDTPQEALEDLEETKKEYFIEFLEKGINISEPEPAKKEFRGEFLFRMPKILHEELYNAAKSNKISLNQYMLFLLTRNFQTFQVGELVTQCFQHFWKNMWIQNAEQATLKSETINQFKVPERKELVA